ncbi:hypothetical protein K3L72_15395 [Bacillus altitudinis]|uniref:Uncharacterized protein n=1 Tax=Bacillus sp. BS1807G30 TaxID=3153756 RepID=A0AAU7FHX9_9BACI|nr:MULTISPECIES: hypothetical protein [Bacillus]CVN19301.1 Uncharacterised protein [Streptococcus pneumoniae]MCW4359159.1 hypothetical protein [Bacillus altitudinis]MCY7498548.1 hypothetical protein [Bacillus altitudinis]MCY7537267.1 hypothetical protein [Bacillus altitudinis]MCY7547790.1 hypothetical protein [Bacillus altitudinis]
MGRCDFDLVGGFLESVRHFTSRGALSVHYFLLILWIKHIVASEISVQCGDE